MGVVKFNENAKILTRLNNSLMKYCVCMYVLVYTHMYRDLVKNLLKKEKTKKK